MSHRHKNANEVIDQKSKGDNQDEFFKWKMWFI